MKSFFIPLLLIIFIGRTAAAPVEVLNVKFNLYNYEAKVTFSGAVDASGAIYSNFELRNNPPDWSKYNLSPGLDDKKKADAEGKVWIFVLKNNSASGLPGTAYEGGALYFRIGLDDFESASSGLRDMRDNSLLPRYNIVISKSDIYYDSSGDPTVGRDFTGWENHVASRRLEANSITVDNGAFIRPATFASWRSVYWVKPNSGATNLNVNVKVATGFNVTFKQDGLKKTATTNSNTFSASFATNNGKAMTEIEVTVSDGTSERSYYLDVCGKDPFAHDVVAAYYGLLPFPKTGNTSRVLVDQIVRGQTITPAQIDFIANYLVGSQKNTRNLIDPVKAINPAWHSLHYHLAIWNGDADIIINNNWTQSEWLHVKSTLFQQDPYIFMYGKNKNTGETTWLRDVENGAAAYLMNITNETYYQYLLNNLVYQCESTGYDAIFFDSYSMACVYSFTNGNYINYGAGNVPYEFTEYQNPQLGGLTWLQASEEYLSRMNKDLNRRGIWLLPNLGDMTCSWDPLDYALCNGGMLEATPIRPDNSGNTGDQYYLFNWIQSMSRTMFLTQKDRVIFLQPYLDDVKNMDYRMFVMGEYLMVRGNYTYLNSCISGQSQASWYPEYEIDLGAPTQTSVIPDILFTPWKESIDKALLNYKEGNLFIRRFEKGIVILNPNKTAQQYTVPTDKSYQMAVISGGGTVPASGIGGLVYSLKWTDVSGGATKTIPAVGALILRFDGPTSIPAVSQATDLKAWKQDGMLYVSGLTIGEPWRIYSVSGEVVYQSSSPVLAENEAVVLSLTGIERGIYIIQSGDKVLKVIF